MKYWVTTHWAPEEDEEESLPRGIWVPDGREQAGQRLQKGDYVLLYQAGAGPTVLRQDEDGQDERIGRSHGRQGIVVIGRACSSLQPDGADEPQRYVGRESIWWRWHADTDPISTNGFVPLQELNKVLGYKTNYNLHGFGDFHSGLKEITEDQYNELVRLFRRRSKATFAENAIRKSGRKRADHWESAPESNDHQQLKQFIASNPSIILKERGLRTLAVEYSFDSGDRADIVLQDHAGRIIGLEVEVSVDPTDVTGILQAIKYRHMLAFVHRCKYEETRAFLVAYAITKQLRRICERYSVECFIIPQTEVKAWTAAGRSNA